MKSLLKLSAVLFFLFGLIVVCLYLPERASRFFPVDTLEAVTEAKREALFYQKLENSVVQCQLCPRSCTIPPGKRGYCGVRENQGGRLYTLSYARPVSVNDLDPVEKKPLFHFLPGTKCFSIATAGCNLKCAFCQNWEISQRLPEEVEYVYLEPEALVEKIKASGRPTVAYTYTEPTIFYEYMLDTAKQAKQAGIKNIMHSNGYINEAPLRQLALYLDAANIDLKGFTDDFYLKMTQGHLEPVLKALRILKEEGVHLEITNLILPGYNDNENSIIKMCLWIKDNLGEDTPLHFSRFFPMYKMLSLNPTPIEILERARRIAMDCGLRYVYIGNVGGNPAENTFCPRCKKIVIRRTGYMVSEINVSEGKCTFCQEEIKGVWN